MIELKSFRNLDAVLIGILAIIWALLSYTVDFMWLVVISVISIIMVSLLCRRCIAAIIFFLLASVLAYCVNNYLFYNMFSYYFIGIFLIFSMLYEGILYLLRKRYVMGILVATAVSSASIPWSMWLLTSRTKELLINTASFSINCLLIGLFTAVVALLVWYKLRENKHVLRFVNREFTL